VLTTNTLDVDQNVGGSNIHTISKRPMLIIGTLMLIVALGLMGAVGYYWLAGGWLLALKGGAVYVFFVFVAWLLRGRSEEGNKENKKTSS
jgi:hypothetical protein